MITKLEDEKKIFVFRPSKSINISPIRKTVKELEDAYALGYNDGLDYLSDLY